MVEHSATPESFVAPVNIHIPPILVRVSALMADSDNPLTDGGECELGGIQEDFPVSLVTFDATFPEIL